MTTPRRPFPLREFVVACVAALLLVLAAYSNSYDNAFHFDDSHVIVENVFIRDLRNIPRFFTDATTFSSLPSNATYRPVVSVTLALDYAMGGGLKPRAFHVTQIVLFCLIGVMLVALFRTILRSVDPPLPSYWVALLAATLFCVHTGNTQPVNYISARSELLSAIGVLGVLLTYACLPRLRRYQFHLLPMVFGALAKTPAVIAAPLLLAYALLIEEQLSLREVFSSRAWPRTHRALVATAPAFVAAIALYAFVEGMNPAGQGYGGGDRFHYGLTQLWVWVHYVRVFFLPHDLSADTDLGLIPHWRDARVVIGLACVTALLVLAWRASRRRETRPAALGILWFAIGLVPSSTIFPLAEVANDHRIFLPFMGLSLAVTSWVALRFLSMTRPAAATAFMRVTAGVTLGVLMLGGFAFATHRRNRVWRTEETLWRDVVLKSPGNGRGLMNYGLTHMAVGRYTEARQYFGRAEPLLPAYSTLQTNLAIVEAAMGNTQSAQDHFARALALAPDDAVGHRFYSDWLFAQGRGEEAIVHLERSLALSGADIETRHRLMMGYAIRGLPQLDSLARGTLAIDSRDAVSAGYLRGVPPLTSASNDYSGWFDVGTGLTSSQQHTQAALAYRAALRWGPDSADAWNNLGWTLGKLGLFEDAVPALENAVRLRSHYALAANNLAWVRTQVAAARFQRGFALTQTGRAAESVPLFRDLLVTAPSWTNAHYNLGCALMSLGRYGEASSEFTRTLELQPDFTGARLNLDACFDSLGRTTSTASHL